ncbi:SDR family oxidoreductase [Streptantibioticus silvisoli]|uniref:3-beta hydroxysteroid dehydrogenase n=1 Tax=Streptantibioticus silvisoli TaxID=2705255 RepID=A0ABT6WB03_9ACTN|nr:3-beta hydroxysteroid dehydrogenase [Streptantibioticus silvisoli]MDI5967671.1 3-beta hydroxysteroid dehydrogenase [Streptantibioticus silvisoli]
MRIAVAGGTGCVGRLVTDAVRAAGHEPAVLARSRGVDLVTGAGLDAALAGAERVIDVSNVSGGVAIGAARSTAFFEAATANLLRAGRQAGVAHHVVLSIVGSDRVGLGYYRGKRRQEALVVEGGVPFSVLRTTQFHEFAAQTLRRGPLVLVPRMLSRPVAAAEVADALVRLAVGAPAGLAPEFAGPEERQMVAMVRQLLRARGSRRPVLPVRLPGAVGEGLAGGALLPAGPGPRGRQSFDEWLAEHGTGRTGA